MKKLRYFFVFFITFFGVVNPLHLSSNKASTVQEFVFKKSFEDAHNLTEALASTYILISTEGSFLTEISTEYGSNSWQYQTASKVNTFFEVYLLCRFGYAALGPLRSLALEIKNISASDVSFFQSKFPKFYERLLSVRNKAGEVLSGGSGVGNLLLTFKSKLVSRLQSSVGFTLKHTDKEIVQIINKGKSLNLTDDIIDDMLFISCRDAKPINATELMTQMDNWTNIVSIRGYPYKFNDMGQFNSFKNELKTGLDDINVTTADVRIQGSSLRTPNANDVDLAAIISENDFDNFLVNRFNNKIMKNSNLIDLTSKTKQELIDIANDYNTNPSLYNNQAKSFSKSMLERKVSAYSNDKVIPGFKELYNSIKGNYPNLNIENITIQTSGGSFDLKPFIKL